MNRHHLAAAGCTLGALGANLGYNAHHSGGLLALAGLLAVAAIWEIVIGAT
jgi:hypothetical protein